MHRFLLILLFLLPSPVAPLPPKALHAMQVLHMSRIRSPANTAIFPPTRGVVN